ncbi:MAG: hypothetical protein ACE5G2_04770, partial [Candidatus Krumholzibacteriia bacterium]
MLDDDEANQPTDGTPEQIHVEIRDADLLFAEKRTGDLSEVGSTPQQVSQPDLASAFLRSTSSTFDFGNPGWLIGDRVASDPGDEMMSSLKERENDLAAGVEGISNQDQTTLEVWDER